MKGATAEPWLRTIKPPMETSTTSIGSIQNFLRTRLTGLPACTNTLELVFHRTHRVFILVSFQPVGLGIGLQFLSQKILAQQAHDQAGWSNRDKKDESDDDG